MEKAIQPKKRTFERQEMGKPLFLYNLLCFLFLFTSMASSEIPKYMGFTAFPIYSVPLHFLCCAANILLGIVIIVLGHRHFGGKVNWFILIPILALALGEFIALLELPASITVYFPSPVHPDPTTYAFTSEERFRFFLSAICTCLSLYVFFVYAPLGKKNRAVFYFVYEAMIVFALVSVFYSYIKEAESYRQIFSGHLFEPWCAPVAFYGQKNIFARFLMVGVFAELYLVYVDRHYFRYLVAAYLCASILFTADKTIIVILFFLIPMFLVFQGVTLWKERRKTAIAHLSVLGVFLLGILLLFVIPKQSLGPLQRLVDLIVSGAHGGGTVEARKVIWDHCLEIWKDSPVSIVFGRGSYAYSYLINNAMDFVTEGIGTSHNVWIEALGRGGILRLLVSVYFLGGFIFILVRNALKKRKDAYLALIFLACMLFHSMLEVSWMMDMMAESICLTFLLVIPSLSKDGDVTPEIKGTRIALIPMLRIAKEIVFFFSPALVIVFVFKGGLLGLGLSAVAIFVQVLILCLSDSAYPRRKARRFGLVMIEDAIAMVIAAIYPAGSSMDMVALGAGYFVVLLATIAFIERRHSYCNFTWNMRPLENLYASLLVTFAHR